MSSYTRIFFIWFSGFVGISGILDFSGFSGPGTCPMRCGPRFRAERRSNYVRSSHMGSVWPKTIFGKKQCKKNPGVFMGLLITTNSNLNNVLVGKKKKFVPNQSTCLREDREWDTLIDLAATSRNQWLLDPNRIGKVPKFLHVRRNQPQNN